MEYNSLNNIIIHYMITIVSNTIIYPLEFNCYYKINEK